MIHSEVLELKYKFICAHESWSLSVITQCKKGRTENYGAVTLEKEGASLTDWNWQKLNP